MEVSAVLLIGVDGGGTHSRLMLSDETGRILATGEGGGINFNAIGMEQARANLFDAAEALLDSQSARLSDCSLLSVGSSALDAPAGEALTAEFCGSRFAPERCLMDSDAAVSLLAAARGEAGILLSAGTGSMGAAIDARGNRYVGGGWGYLLGDSGSGFDIGRRALLAAAEAEEGGAPTLLRALFLRRFELNSVRALLPVLYGPDFHPADLAAFAPVADCAAEKGDAVAAEILATAAAASARLCAFLYQQSGAEHVYVYGGVFEHSHRYNAAFLNALNELGLGHLHVSPPLLPPEAGALLAAAHRLDLAPAAFLSKLEQSIEIMRNKAKSKENAR